MLCVENLVKRLPHGQELLRGIHLRVEPGEFVGILGPSGAGKSLSLRCILGLTKADQGSIRFAPASGPQYEMTTLKGRALRHARRQMGVVFQEFNLVERLSVLENVLLGRLGWIRSLRSCLYGFTDREASDALQSLKLVKMETFAARRAGTLSRGEMQRVALARAIHQRPAIFLVDEPISSVDPANARAIMELLAPLAQTSAVLGAFHQPEMTARYCTRVVGIRRGQIVYDGPPTLEPRQLSEIYGEEPPP